MESFSRYFVCVDLAFFTQYNIFEIPPCDCTHQSLFVLLLSGIQFYEYNNLLIHSSSGGHLSWFHIFIYYKGILLWTFLCKFFCSHVSFLLGEYLGVELLLLYKKLPVIQSDWTILHSYQPCTMLVLVALHPHQCVYFFCCSYSSTCKMISDCSFNLHFPDD